MNEQNFNQKDIYVRTMKEDIEKLQKGLPPELTTETISTPSNLPSDELTTPQTPQYQTTEITEPLSSAPMSNLPQTEIPTMPEIQIPEEGKKLNLPLILGIGGAAFILIIGGIASYFLLFKKPASITQAPLETPEEIVENVPIEQEPETATTPSEQTKPIELKAPQNFIFTDFTQTVNLASKSKEELEIIMKNIISSPKEFDKTNTILLKLDLPEEKSYLSVKDIFKILNIAPTEFLNQLENESQLIGYTQEGEQKLGFIVKINNPDTLKSVMSIWENKMLNDLAPNFLNRDPKTLKPATSSFLDNTYLGVEMRYLNLPTSSITFDYAIIPEKKLLLFTTSKNSMFKLIELLIRGF